MSNALSGDGPGILALLFGAIACNYITRISSLMMYSKQVACFLIVCSYLVLVLS
jgi:hypothetical protein